MLGLALPPQYVTAIGDVHASTLLIGFQEISAEHGAALFPDKCFFFRRKPVFECLFLAHVARKRVRIAAPDHRLENYPNCIMVGIRLRVEWPREKLTSTRQVFKPASSKIATPSSFALSYSSRVGADYNVIRFLAHGTNNLSAMLFDNFPGLFARTIGSPPVNTKDFPASLLLLIFGFSAVGRTPTFPAS